MIVDILITLKNKRRLYVSARIGSSSQFNDANTGNLIGGPIKLRNTIIAELLAGYRFFNNWIIETGISTNQLNLGYSIREFSGGIHGSSSSSGGIDFFGIPMRIKHEFDLNNRISASPYFGLTHMVSLKKGQIGSIGLHGHNENEEPMVYTETTRFIDRSYGLLIGGGASFEYNITPLISFLVNGEYDYGLHNLKRYHIEHYIDDSVISGDIYNRGTGFKFSAGINFKI